MTKKAKAWIFNLVMLALFLLIAVYPIKEGKSLIDLGLDQLFSSSIDKNKTSESENSL